jgi:hypothetical protein
MEEALPARIAARQVTCDRGSRAGRRWCRRRRTRPQSRGRRGPNWLTGRWLSTPSPQEPINYRAKILRRRSGHMQNSRDPADSRPTAASFRRTARWERQTETTKEERTHGSQAQGAQRT